MDRVDQKQQEIEDYQNQMQEVSDQRGEYLQQAEDYAQQALALAAAATYGSPSETNVTSYVQAYNQPWPDIDPDKCCDTSHCSVTWSLTFRDTIYFFWGGTWQGGWNLIMSGCFTPAGTPIILWCPRCPVFNNYACYSNNCAVGGQYCHVYEHELKMALTFPAF
jgi:hypothetical protein